MESLQGKKRTVIIGIGCVIALAVIVFLVWWLWPRASTKPSVSSSATNAPGGGVANVSFSQDDYQAALQRAQSWESDAALLNMTSGGAGGQLWNFVFVSQKANGQAFQVTMNGQTVVSTQEVSISGSGAPLPQNIIPPAQALAAAHAVPGDASAKIQSIQLVYSAAANQWYWGMKTANGFTISVKATP